MSENNETGAFFIGIVVGFCIIATISVIFPSEQVKQYKNAINECEKTLPRNQHCVVVAVPVDKN